MCSAGGPDTLQRLCDDMLTAARSRAAMQELIGIASFSAWALYRRGELADAEAQARWAVERATGIYAIDSLAHLIEILIDRDAMSDAEDELSRITPLLDSHSIVVGFAPASLGATDAAGEESW